MADRRCFVQVDFSSGRKKMISGFERGKGPPEKRFMVDIMLGKLARWLRILGFDTLYGPLAGPWDILCRTTEGRIVLTRNRRWCGLEGVLCLSANDPMEQLTEAARRLSLQESDVNFLSRCAVCNHQIEKVSRLEAFGHVPDYTYETQSRFCRCPSCHRFYWAGSHPSRMRERLCSLFPWRMEAR